MIRKTCNECNFGDWHAKAEARIAELEAQVKEARREAEEWRDADWDSRMGDHPDAECHTKPLLPWETNQDNAKETD